MGVDAMWHILIYAARGSWRGLEARGSECSWVPLAVDAPVKDARGTLGAHLGQDLLPFSASDRKLKSKQAANKVRLSQLASFFVAVRAAATSI